MNGRELAEAARATRPDLPVLFTTGYAHDVAFQQGGLDRRTELLTKPFNRMQLAERVRRLLDSERPAVMSNGQAVSPTKAGGAGRRRFEEQVRGNGT